MEKPTMSLETLTYSKQEQQARIAWKLTTQDKHINYDYDNSDVTYVSSVWLRQQDKNYYKSGRFDKYFTSVDTNYNYLGKNRYAKAVKLTPYTKELANQALQLPTGYFVSQHNKKKYLKKLGKSVSVCPLRQDWTTFIQDVREGKVELSEQDRNALLWLSLFVDNSGTLFAGYRIVGERKTYFTPNLQQLKKGLRDLVLQDTKYCDVDATRSFHYDYEYLINKYGNDCLTTEQIDLLVKFSGLGGREAIAEETGLEGITLKKATLSLIMGGTKDIKDLFDSNLLARYNYARQTFTKFLFATEEFANLDGFVKQEDEWEYEDYGKCLSRVLFRLETIKMEEYSRLLEAEGFKTLQFMYDGLILDKEISQEQLEVVSRTFETGFWSSPLKVDKIW